MIFSLGVSNDAYLRANYGKKKKKLEIIFHPLPAFEFGDRSEFCPKISFEFFRKIGAKSCAMWSKLRKEDE